MSEPSYLPFQKVPSKHLPPKNLRTIPLQNRLSSSLREPPEFLDSLQVRAVEEMVGFPLARG
jgi:hypothetical protein